jgi:hypothetical protein
MGKKLENPSLSYLNLLVSINSSNICIIVDISK